jgi:gas vesicle protein
MIALMAGFAAGILLAPDKGSVTRKKLSDGFDYLADKLSDLKDKFATEKADVTEEATFVPKMSASV